MGILNNKTILITGIASTRSIAYGIAKAMHNQSAKLVFTYQNEKLKDRVENIAKEFNSTDTFQCDVGNEEEIINLHNSLSSKNITLDGFVHSIAFAKRESLNGDYHSVTDKDAFLTAHDISSYSLLSLAKYLQPLLNSNSSITTLSYYGAQKVMPSYNIMGVAKASLEANVRYLAASMGPYGIRVNAISAGPIKTLAASAIKGFNSILDYTEKVSPLRRNIDSIEVGNSAAFLASDLSSGITGEILYVDAGFNIVAPHHIS